MVYHELRKQQYTPRMGSSDYVINTTTETLPCIGETTLAYGSTHFEEKDFRIFHAVFHLHSGSSLRLKYFPRIQVIQNT